MVDGGLPANFKVCQNDAGVVALRYSKELDTCISLGVETPAAVLWVLDTDHNPQQLTITFRGGQPSSAKLLLVFIL